MPDSTVFSKRMIIVPNQEIQKWIKLKLASDLKIAANLRFSFLKQAIETLSVDFFEVNRPRCFQNGLELTLKIEKELKKLISNDPLFEKVSRYVKGKERRLLSLSKHLANLFRKYGIYGKKACENWEKNPTVWQMKLWQKVYETKEYPLKFLADLEAKNNEADFSLHIFGINHLSELYFNFFLTLSKQIPVFFYHLSFCQEFWSDLPSKKQALNLSETYLDDLNPLLANFGKVGQKMAKMFEESDEKLIIYETYSPPQTNSALAKLQKSLLTLKKEELVDDDSIQFHSSANRHREMQNLNQTLLSLMKEKNYEPKDFLILAPDINYYAPYIRHYFKAYQITDLSLRQKNSQIEAFFLLIKLDEKRWGAPAVLEIFEHPLFLEKTKWQKEDLSLIRSWIHKTGIRLSYKNGSKEEIAATWSAGLSNLFYELATSHSLHIDFNKAELIGEIAHLLETWHDLLLEKKEKKSLKEWTLYFKKFMEFFAESEEQERLEELLDAFAKNGEGLFSFEIVSDLLHDWIEKERWIENPNQIQVMRFSTFGPMKALPHKVICLLGMNEELPKKERGSFFDLLKNEGDFCPTGKQIDQNGFLEAAMAAKEILILSYLSDEPVSSFVATTKQLFSSKRIISHPARSYDSKYFDGEHALKNSSYRDFELAQKFSKKMEPSSFFLAEREKRVPAGIFEIEIDDLIRALRSPLKHYLKHAFLCKLKEEEEIQDEEEFTLSPLTVSILRKDFFKNCDIKNMPSGFFGKVARLQIEEEKEALMENTKGFEWRNLILTEGRKKEEAGLFFVPPLQIKVNDATQVILTGKIENLYSKGILSLDTCTLASAAKMWPLFLIACAIEPPQGFEMKEVFFAKEPVGKPVKKERFFSDAKEGLKALLEFYFVSQKVPVVLSYGLLEPVLKDDFAKFEKRLYQENYDPYLNWATRGRKLDLKELMKVSHECAVKMYQEMKDAWF